MPSGKVVRSFYSSAAAEYRRLWAPELVSLAHPLLDRLPLARSTRVLDAGAGVGSLLPELAERAPRATVVGVDLAEGMLRLASHEYPRAVMDITRLGVRGSVFEVALIAFVLFHLEDPAAGLEEIARVLQPGGLVGTITWGEDPSYPAHEIWTEELDAAGAATAEALISRHDLVDSVEKVRGYLERAGFEALDVRSGAYRNQMTLETFLEHRLGHGMSRRRFESLDPDRRVTCLERARTRLKGLSREGFAHRAEVIYGVGAL